MSQPPRSGKSPSNEGDDFVLPPLATDLSPGTSVGGYVIQELLGEGGMATVYGAMHPVIRKKAAIKVLSWTMSAHRDYVERFVQEARAVNAIGHPNIVDVFAFGTLPDGRCWFAMEWLEGETLYQRLWDRRLTLEEVYDIVQQICDALDAAHEKGVIHRDLKPANIFLVPTRSGREKVKLLDFGVAKLSLPREGGGTLGFSGPRTENGQVVGTPDYISPEQARGINVDHRTDIYSLGVLLYEMVLGRLPFIADNTLDKLRMHLSDPPPPPRGLWPEIPSPLEELILGLLSKAAKDRPTLADVQARLHELRGTPVPIEFDEPGSRRPSMATPPPIVAPVSTHPPPSPRRTLARAAILGGAIAAIALLLVWLGRPQAPAPAPTPAPVAVTPAAPPPPAEPAPPVEPAPKPGTLLIKVNSPDATIELDGQRVAQGVSQARLSVERPGEHTLVVTAPGRRTYSGTVALNPGATAQVSVRLDRGRAVPTPQAAPVAAPAPAKPAPGAKPAAKRGEDPDYLVDPF